MWNNAYLNISVVMTIFLLALPYPASAKVIYVDANAPGLTHDGSSWTNAYKYLQDALADAGPAVKPIEIRVAQGIYTPDSNSAYPNGNGDRTATFQLINGVTLKGGYAGFGQPDPNARDIEFYETFLSGDLDGNDVDVNDPIDLLYEPTRAENSYHIVTGNSTDTTAILDGFTITAGNANGPQQQSQDRGGGMYNYQSSPTVINCIFTANSAKQSGGGMGNFFTSNPNLYKCTFRENSAGDRGGGMYNYLSSPYVSNCTFANNSARLDGAAMSNRDYSSPNVTNCTFIANSTNADGGGMSNFVSSPQLNNCTFSENSADYWGGGMSNFFSSPHVNNCTFTDNLALSGGGMSNHSSGPNLNNCSFTANLAWGGGGIMNYRQSNPNLNNCTLTGNLAWYGGGMGNERNSSPTLINCTMADNYAVNGPAMACDSVEQQYPSNVTILNCIIWNWSDWLWNNDASIITITYSDLEGGSLGNGNINADPCFASLGYWDPNGTPEDANDDFWIIGDYHLKSQAGRWDPNSESWVRDDVTSPCIDAGNPGCPEANEPEPNGNRRNMGAYGGTEQASKSPAYWRSIADITNDWVVDSKDLKVFVGYWLQTGECIPGDLDHSRFVDSNDFAIFGGQWRQKGPGPGITYKVDECVPIEPLLSISGEAEPTRFTVTVEGSNIRFEDLITANCCADEIELLMTVEAGLITIYEIEHTPMPPCPCICDYPITATLGPFEPGTYIFAVYQNEGFIGSTTVTIGPAS